MDHVELIAIARKGPIRIHTNSGTRYDVTHPETILIGRTASAVMIDGQISLIGNMHISHVELVEA